MNEHCTIGDVNARVSGQATPWALFDDGKKQSLIYLASLDIEQFVGMPRENMGVPYGLGDAALIDACIEQTLFIMRNEAARSMGEAAEASGAENISDGITSLTYGRRKISPVAAIMVSEYKRRAGLAGSGHHFKRG